MTFGSRYLDARATNNPTPASGNTLVNGRDASISKFNNNCATLVHFDIKKTAQKLNTRKICHKKN